MLSEAPNCLQKATFVHKITILPQKSENVRPRGEMPFPIVTPKLSSLTCPITRSLKLEAIRQVNRKVKEPMKIK